MEYERGKGKRPSVATGKEETEEEEEEYDYRDQEEEEEGGDEEIARWERGEPSFF